MMIARLIIGILALMILIYVGISSSLIAAEMVDNINLHRKPENQIDWIGWGPFKRQSVNNEHQDLYPNSNFQTKLRRRIFIGFGALFVVAMCIMGK